MAWYDKYYDENGYEVGGVSLPACSWYGPVPEHIFKQICADVEQLEREGVLDNMFKGNCVDHRELPTKDKLMDSISSDMKLYKSTFMKIYGYELTWPGFAEIALAKLESVGCEKAREHYARIVGEYEGKHNTKLREVAKDYRKQCEEEYENRKRKEVRNCKEELAKMSNSELLMFLENLVKEG